MYDTRTAHAPSALYRLPLGTVLPRQCWETTHNRANFTTSQQVGASSRTRYHERAILLFKRAVLLLSLSPFLVTTDFMMADIFTKATDKATFIKMRNAMMNVHGSLRGALERGYQLSCGSMRRLAGSLYDRLAQE